MFRQLAVEGRQGLAEDSVLLIRMVLEPLAEELAKKLAQVLA